MASARAVAPLLVALFGLAAFLQGCGGGGGGGGANDIAAVAGKTEDLSTLVTALKAAGLVDTLSGKDHYTVFAPSNEAFSALPPAQLTYLLNSKDELKKVLLYHVVSGDVKSGALKDGEEVPTVEGSNVTVKITTKGNATTVKINGATVTMADVAASNGVIHIVNKVLVPPDVSFPTITNLVSAGNFNTLLKALTAANLQGILAGKGPFTVFAPTDAAFAAVPNLEALLKNIPELTKILEYHVVASEVLSSELKNGEQVKTLEKQDLNISISGSVVSINKAKVTKADVVAVNGVVHVIDAVLIPPATPSTCGEIMVGVNCNNGKDIGNKPVKTQEDCCQYCKTTSGCAAWTWNQDKKMDPAQGCYLHTDCKSQTKKAGVISGKMDPKIELVEVVV